MTNIVFDLSNMFFRSMFIVGGYGKEGFTFGNQFEVDKLMRKVATDITYIIRQTNPSRVVFALDSKSWRKEIEIEENEGYKAHRTKSSHINWDNVFATMTEFGEILDQSGFIVTKVEKAEADDIMALWRDELLFNQNQHVILVSSDEDVRQLAAFFPYEPGKMVFSTIFNPFTSGRGGTKRLFVPAHFNEWLTKEEFGTIFDRGIDVDKDDFKNLINQGIAVEEVDGNQIGVKKVLCGDDGDNVPSIYSWIAKDSIGEPIINKKTEEPRIDRITNAKYQKIVDTLKISDYIDLMDNADEVKAMLKKISKLKTDPPFDIKKRIKRQCDLVILSSTLFPKSIVEEFSNKVEESLQRPQIYPQDWNVNTLLEGTRYVKSAGRSKYTGAESSIFREVDNIAKKLF